ncbi:MAG TPA: hypothetical protein VN655_08855 [Pseudolabrys sp.]|jgi:hypothetical protein|nr:hypothetical protein [Pseudolabrys sp.]
MSALGLDDLDDPRGVLAYAPRRHRRSDDESSIRPILERLSRSEGRVPGPRMMRREPVQDVPPPAVETVAKSAVPMAARLAIAGAALALVGAAAAGYFALPGEDHARPPSAAAASSLPKPVQTLSIQRPDDAAEQPAARLVKDDARMPQANADIASTAGALPRVAPAMPLQPSAPADPSASPLKAWAAVPVGAATPGWTSPTRTAADQPPAQTADAAPAPAEGSSDSGAGATEHKPVHHARHAEHRRPHRRSRAARAHATQPQAEQAAQPAETEAAQPQPTKKLPLQAAIDRLFGNSGRASAPPPPQQ